MYESEHLDLALIGGLTRQAPFVLPWPLDGLPSGWLEFRTPEEWQDFVASLGLPSHIPEIVAAKYRRAQMLYFLAWLYGDLIKAGELVALTALELTLRDRYGNTVKGRRGDKADFATLLRCLQKDGLTNEKIPMVRRSGGNAMGFVTGKNQPSLADRRNDLAHGDPFDAMPCAGLLELVRDLIVYAYRDWIV
jgi:hypothetical protein